MYTLRRRRRVWPRRILLTGLLLAAVGGPAVYFYGDTVVPPVVDAVRGVLGPAAVAGIESGYYGFLETARGWQRDLGLAPPVAAPWATPAVAGADPAAPPPAGAQAEAGATPAPPGTPLAPSAPAPLPGAASLAPAPGKAATAAPTSTRAAPAARAPGAAAPAPSALGAPPDALAPLVAGPLAGEGQWSSAGLPQPPGGAPPALWKTYLRPDPARPYALAYLVRFDPRQVQLHVVAGTHDPGSAIGVRGPGQVPAADRAHLLAAFNGGFKWVNGNYGMVVDGRTIAPPNPADDTATLAFHADGRVTLSAWAQVRAAPDVLSYRQNCPLLIDQGAIVVANHLESKWGLSALSQMYVWRSALGMTADGSLIFAAGNPVSAPELAAALQQAGAVTAMQLDINSAWVHWLSYVPGARGTLRATPLVSGMAYRSNQYLVPNARDFFYLTW